MTTVTLRQQKLSPLTNQEIDDNFSNLNTNKLESVVYPNLTTSGSGWYRVATTNTDGRGTYDLEVYTTGGNHDPSVLKIVAQCNWTGGRVLYAIWDGVFPASSVRVTRSASNSYLEVYFTTSVNTFAVRVNHTGFASGIVGYSGALSSGGDTVAETLALTSRLNVGTAGLTGHLTGTTASFSSYVTMGSLVANDPGSSYYSYTHRLGGSVAVAGNLLVVPATQLMQNLADGFIGFVDPSHSAGWGVSQGIGARTGDVIWALGSNGSTGDSDTLYLGIGSIANSTFSTALSFTQNKVATVHNNLRIFGTGVANPTTADNTDNSILSLRASNALVRLQFGTRNTGNYAAWIQASYDNGGGANGLEPLELNPLGGTVFANGYTVLNANNYTSYSPTLTGGGASGTWSINITGSATSLNFGNGYTVQMGDWGLRNTTPYGWIQLGPANSSWAHIYADRTFYFNQELYVNGNQVLHANNYTSYTLPIGGSWYGSGLPGSRWGGFNVNGGEIAFGRDLPNNGQMGILIDGCYIAGENNGFWSLASDNTWGSRRGMYWDGSYLNFTTNTPTVKATKTLQDELVVSNRTDFGAKRSYYIGNLTASGTQARRFEIARVYIDYNDWHMAGVIQVELHNYYYTGGDYQLWNISYDYNNVSCTLIAGDSPRGRYADVKCSSPVQISGDYYYISIYVDVRHYAYYYAYIHTSWPETTTHQAQSGNILVYTAGNVGITNISDFTPSSTIATSNIIQSYSSLRAPVFYDSDNTGYYLDPNSTSRVTKIVQDERYDATNIGTYGGLFSGNWQSLTNSTGQFNVVQVNNISDGNHSNYPGSVYTYGGVLSWRALNHSFQLYASHTGSLAYKTQWNNDNYSGWLYPVVYGRNEAASSIYGTIFYDSNDTSYYVDPTSTSKFNALQFRSGSTDGPIFYYGNNDRNLYLKGASGTDVGLAILDSSGNGRIQLYGSSSSYGFLNNIWYQWDIQKFINGNLYLNNQLTYYLSDSEIYYNRVYGISDIRSPYFYHHTDTNYYINPANGTYVFGGIWNNGGHGNSVIRNRLLSTNNGAATGEVRLQMWCSEPGNTWDWAGFGYNVDNNINESGNVPVYHLGRPNTSFGQAYMRFSTGGDWYFYNTPSGSNTRYTTMRLASTGFIENYSSIRAPIFYDYDNTDYYANPAGTSIFNTLQMYNKIIAGSSNNNGSTSGIWMWNSSDSNWAIYMAQPTVGINPGGGTMSAGYWNNDHSIRIRAGGFSYERYDTNTVMIDSRETGTYFAGQIRSPIFYDTDTSYYCDPDGTNRLNFVNSNNHYIQPGYMLYSDHGSWQGEYNKIQWHSSHLYLQNNGGGYLLILRRGDGGERFYCDYSGNVTASGNITAYSDQRLKTNIETIANPLELVNKLRGVTFDWIETGKHSYGLIAQEVEQVIPELVLETTNGNTETDISTTVKSVDYSKLVSVLIEAVKEQQQQIDKLTKLVETLLVK